MLKMAMFTQYCQYINDEEGCPTYDKYNKYDS